jgi:hypothetical protein
VAEAAWTIEQASNAEPKIVRIVFRIRKSPLFRRVVVRQKASLVSARCSDITIALADYYGCGHHEAASKFLGQKNFRLNIQQASGRVPLGPFWTSFCRFVE